MSLLILLILLACAPPLPDPAPTPVARVTPSRADVLVVPTLTDDRLILDVTSPTGIGNALVELPTPPPRNVRVQLHLRGLEAFSCTCGTSRITASLTSEGRLLETLERPEGSQEMTPEMPQWLAVQRVTTSADETLFTVDFPADFFREGQGSITVGWVDFYR